jgi:hypothetical protein
MAARKQPHRWLFFALDTVPQGDDGPMLFRWSTRPIVYNAFPAFIEGRVPVDGWLDIVRSASSMSGEYSVDHGAAVLNDADGMIRALLAEYSTQWFLKRQGHFLLLSDQAIRAGLLPPRILLCGKCSDVQLLDDRKAQTEFEDVFAPYLDRLYPQYTLGDAYPYLFEGDDVTDVDTIDENDPNLQIPRALRDQVLCIYYGPQVETRQDPVTGVAVQERMCPLFFMGFLAGNFGDAPPDAGEFPPELASLMSPFGPEEHWGNWGEVVLGAGELEVPAVAVSNLAEKPEPVILTEDRYGVDALFPGHAGWPFATNYVMRNGFKLTVGYLRGPVLWHHITGICQATADTCGWPSFDEETFEDTDPIDQAGFGWQSFLSEHVLAHDGAGFTSGPQVGLPLFDPTVDIDRAMIWTSKIQAWQAMTAARLLTEKGYLISMALTKPTRLREILRTFNVSFDAFHAKNSAGQHFLFSLDDTASASDGRVVRERIQLLTLPAPRIDWPAIENEIDFTYGWDPKRDAARTITITVRDQPSIDALDGDVRKVDGVRSLAYTANDATARDVMGRRLLRVRNAPRYQSLPLRTEGVDLEIGEQVRVSHRDGIGPAGVGYDLRPMVQMKSTHRGDDVTWEAFDVGQILASTGHVGSDEMTDWESATDEERALYFFATFDDGTVPPDGVRGLEIR